MPQLSVWFRIHCLSFPQQDVRSQRARTFTSVPLKPSSWDSAWHIRGAPSLLNNGQMKEAETPDPSQAACSVPRGGLVAPGRTYLHTGHVHRVESLAAQPHWHQDDHGLPLSRGVRPGHQPCHICLVHCKDNTAGHILTHPSSLGLWPSTCLCNLIGPHSCHQRKRWSFWCPTHPKLSPQ